MEKKTYMSYNFSYSTAIESVHKLVKSTLLQGILSTYSDVKSTWKIHCIWKKSTKVNCCFEGEI